MIHVFYMISMLDAIVPLYIKPSAIRPNDGTLNRTFGCIVKGNAILRLECAGMLGSHSRVLRYSFDGKPTWMLSTQNAHKLVYDLL
jgi:hypothetical protein